MFDYSKIKKKTSDIVEANSTKVFSIGDVLSKIDNAHYKFYEEMTDDEKKNFTPYTVLRWVSSLDDSMQVTFSSSKVESVFGKWKSGGKEALNELVKELQNENIGCTNVTKYNHGDYDWRIKFSVKSKSDADLLIDSMKQFGITGSEIISLIDSTTLKYQLIMLNDMINDGFWSMKEHPELVYQLLCAVQDMIGKGDKIHNWLPFPKGLKNVNTELFELIKKTQNSTISTQMNEDEYKILLLSYDKQSFKDLLENMGYQDKELKSIFKMFKDECEKYGKVIEK